QVAMFYHTPPQTVGPPPNPRQFHGELPCNAARPGTGTGDGRSGAVHDAGRTELRRDLLAEPEPGDARGVGQHAAVGWVRPDQVGVCTHGLGEHQQGGRGAQGERGAPPENSHRRRPPPGPRGPHSAPAGRCYLPTTCSTSAPPSRTVTSLPRRTQLPVFSKMR